MHLGACTAQHSGHNERNKTKQKKSTRIEDTSTRCVLPCSSRVSRPQSQQHKAGTAPCRSLVLPREQVKCQKGGITVPFAFTAPPGLASKSAPCLLNVFASVYGDLGF